MASAMAASALAIKTASAAFSIASCAIRAAALAADSVIDIQ